MSVTINTSKRFSLLTQFVHLKKTFIGNILVAVNPFKQVGYYTSDVMYQYRDAVFGENPPHIFALAELSYKTVRETEKSVSVIIR